MLFKLENKIYLREISHELWSTETQFERSSSFIFDEKIKKGSEHKWKIVDKDDNSAAADDDDDAE